MHPRLVDVCKAQCAPRFVQKDETALHNASRGDAPTAKATQLSGQSDLEAMAVATLDHQVGSLASALEIHTHHRAG